MSNVKYQKFESCSFGEESITVGNRQFHSLRIGGHHMNRMAEGLCKGAAQDSLLFFYPPKNESAPDSIESRDASLEQLSREVCSRVAYIPTLTMEWLVHPRGGPTANPR